EEARKILRDQLKKTDDPLRRHWGLFQLHRQDHSYYSAVAIKYVQEGKTELAEEARKQAAQSSELAVQSLEQAYQIRPDEPRIHEALLSIYLNGRNWEKAEKLIARAEEANWDGVAGLYFRGRLHNKKGESLAAEDKQAANKEYQEALKCLEEAVQKREKFHQAWAEKARTEEHLGRREAALESARRAEQQNPRSFLAVRLLLELTVGEWSRAEVADNPMEARRLAEETYGLAKRVLKLNPNYRRAEFFKRAYLDKY
ncbi:unnamed protein product, partial [marine sediment metagenome]